MSRFTPQQAADALVDGYLDEYDEDLKGWATPTAKDGVLHIKMTPVDDEGDADIDRAEQFCAVVVEGETVPLVFVPGSPVRFAVADFSVFRDDEIGAYAVRFLDDAGREVIVGLDEDMAGVLLADEFTGCLEIRHRLGVKRSGDAR